ncbi:MAG: DoxX family protein [Myxococcota bacterium]
METWRQLKAWTLANLDVAWDLVRIYIGIGLVVKGVYFIQDVTFVTDTMSRHAVPAASVALAHYVAGAHLAGGALLAAGFVTRLSALVQVPVLFGAVFFVHMQEGLFTMAQNLEFAALVLFLLCLFSVFGAGRLSVDHYVFERGDTEEPTHGTSHAIWPA